VLITRILLHFFGPRYDLPVSLALYIYAAGGVVVLTFVLVAMLAGDRVGHHAVEYPRRAVPFLMPLARSPLPKVVGGVVGVFGLLTVILTGLFGSTDPTRNPAEYLIWIYFWSAMVIASALVGNLWALLNPWAAMYSGLARVVRLPPILSLPRIGVWPAVAGFFCFACLELTSGLANHPELLAGMALAYSALTLIGMVLFGPDQWLNHCEAFSVLFAIVGRFGPVEAERARSRDIQMLYFRPWGVGLLRPSPSGWDRVTFVILMLSTVVFDGIIATPSWQDFTIQLESISERMGAFGFFFTRTLGLVLITSAFLLIFIGFTEAVIYFGHRHVDLTATVSAFALTLVPIALVYNAAHNYGYVLVQSQGLIPLLNDPLDRGWHMLPALASYQPSFALAQASTVWYAQVILVVVGHMISIWLSYLRAGERFRTSQRALLSQYPMLLLVVMSAMTSLWILAQPVTNAV